MDSENHFQNPLQNSHVFNHKVNKYADMDVLKMEDCTNKSIDDKLKTDSMKVDEREENRTPERASSLDDNKKMSNPCEKLQEYRLHDEKIYEIRKGGILSYLQNLKPSNTCLVLFFVAVVACVFFLITVILFAFPKNKVHGGFTVWTTWGLCSVSCGDGSQSRIRTCKNPMPQFGGTDCAGEHNQVRRCKLASCSGTCLAETNQSECLSGEMCVDLNEKGTITGSLAGVSTESSPTGLQGGRACSRQAKFKVTFEKLLANSTGLCHDGIYTGRRMLKVQMYFSATYRHEWMFDIGDSPSNDGWAGDYGHTEYEAEVQYMRSNVNVYANNVNRTDCRAQLLYHYPGITASSTSKINVWIANHYLKVADDNGLCERNCNKCLYGLNGQFTIGSINQDIHVAANRVISGNYRNGYGLCFLKMSWVNSPEE